MAVCKTDQIIWSDKRPYLISFAQNSLKSTRIAPIRANDVSNAYNGLGQRVQQTVSSVVAEYLLDVQPALFVTLAETANGQTRRFVHGPRGIHAFEDNSGNWAWTVQDGLGSVRGELDANLDVQATQQYAPYGDPFGAEGAFGMDYGFTSEPTDDNDLVYLRARYLDPGLGVFASLDPVEGVIQRAMSLNGYGWVEGRVPNSVDPSGECWANTGATRWQQHQCAEAWRGYTQHIADTMIWDREVSVLVSQEARY